MRPSLATTLLLLALPFLAAGEAAPAYTYPPQDGLESLRKSDPACTLLTDGARRSDGAGAVWGKWEARRLAIDWTFPGPVRLGGATVAIVRPDGVKGATLRLHLTAVEDEGDPARAPDFSAVLPASDERIQTAAVDLPADALACRRLRMTVETSGRMIALTEVAFRAEPLGAEAFADALAQRERRRAGRPGFSAPVTFLPPPAAEPAAPPPSGLFGVGGHLLHTDEFYPPGKGLKRTFSPYWRPDHTLPLVAAIGAGWVREPLYQRLFAGTGEAGPQNGRSEAGNRGAVEAALERYQRQLPGVRLMLVPMYTRADEPGFADFFAWIGELARRFPGVAAVELHNEPNLRGFWKHSLADYVAATRAAIPILRAARPDLPLVVGGFSGWGHSAFGDESTRAYEGSPQGKAWNFAEGVCASGLLDLVDGVSTHPYRRSSPPEGGADFAAADDPDGFLAELRAWWAMVQSHNRTGRPLRLYLTEIGFSSAVSGGASVVGSLGRQADYLSRTLLLALLARGEGLPLEAIMWYDLKCDDGAVGGYEANFGLVSQDTAALRPGFLAFRRIAAAFGGMESSPPIDVQAVFSNGDRVVKRAAWRRDDALLLAFWRMGRLQEDDVDFPAELRLRLPEGVEAAAVSLASLAEDRPRRIGFRRDGDALAIPLLVTARAGWVVVGSEAAVRREEARR